MILTRRRALIGGAATLLLPRPAIIRPACAGLVMAPTSAASSWSLINSTSVSSVSGGTSPAVSTVGANLIVVGVSNYQTPLPTFSDNQGNTYTQIGATISSAAIVYTRLFFAISPIVNASHTWTTAGATTYSTLGALAFRGSLGSGSYDQTTNNSLSVTATSLATGSITPTQNNEMIVAVLGVNNGGTSFAVSIGALPINVPTSPGVYEGLMMMYYNQATAAAINPNFTWTTAEYAAAIIASFAP